MAPLLPRYRVYQRPAKLCMACRAESPEAAVQRYLTILKDAGQTPDPTHYFAVVVR